MTRNIREAILWVGATLGVLFIGWTLAMFAFGLTPLVFTSGSMSPAIDAGDLGFAKTVDADQIEVGDVISVVNDRGIRITHRVVQVDPMEGGVTLTMQGDANNQADAAPYSVATTAERVAFSVPKAGYIVNAVSSPVGMFLGGLLAATALFIAFGRRDDGKGPAAPSVPESAPVEPLPDEQDRNVSQRVGRLLTVAAGAGALVVAGAMTAVQPTSAAWTDTATAATGSISSLTLSTIPSIACSGSGGTSVTLSWEDLGPRYEYVVVARDADNDVYSTQTVRGSGGTASAVIARRTSITYSTYEHRVTVTPRLITSTSWTGTPTVRSIWERYNLVAGFNNRVFCSRP